jgi:flagellin
MDAGASDFEFQVGAATGAPNRITVTIDGMSSGELGLGGSTGISESDFAISQHTTVADGVKFDAVVLTKDTAETDTSTDKFDVKITGLATSGETSGGNTLTLFGETVTLTGTAQTDHDAIESKFGGFGVSVSIKSVDTTKDFSDTTDEGNNYLTLTVPQSGASANLSVSSADNARTSIGAVDAAILKVNNQRSELGAVSNRLNHTVNNLTNISSNLSAAKGGIEDADFALETTNLAKNQILQQASSAMLAKANASKQNVLSLLQG